MREDRDYGKFADETTIIEGFEEYERESETDYGSSREDFMDWFLIYRQGFFNGGNK